MSLLPLNLNKVLVQKPSWTENEKSFVKNNPGGVTPEKLQKVFLKCDTAEHKKSQRSNYTEQKKLQPRAPYEFGFALTDRIYLFIYFDRKSVLSNRAFFLFSIGDLRNLCWKRHSTVQDAWGNVDLSPFYGIQPKSFSFPRQGFCFLLRLQSIFGCR